MTTSHARSRFSLARWTAAACLAIGLQLAFAATVLGGGLPTDPEPDIACPSDYGTGWVTQYVTTVNTPADAQTWWVSIEFTIADGSEPASCELSLASYELPGPNFVFPQTLHDADTGTFGAGTHTLTVDLPRDGSLPGCHAQYDFVFGPPIANLTFDDRYDDRQVRSRIVGSDTCPEGETQGGTGEPPLPDTAMSPAGTSLAGSLYALGLVLALGAVGFLNLRAVVASRRR
jgi:hypothetical protein